MRGSFILLGVSLCVLSGGSFEMSSSFSCGNGSCNHFCEICVQYNLSKTNCYQIFVSHMCNQPFHNDMNALNSSSWCMWDKVNSSYNKLTKCTEDFADCLLIPWPNKMVEEIFVDMHKKYFEKCPEETLRDPPPNVVFALVMTPICLIPAMVVLVVLKTKNGDRRS